MDELHHECGIAAIYHLPSEKPSPLIPWSDKEGIDGTSRLMPRVLLDLQNRGQLAAGMTSFNPKRDIRLDTYKEIGTVIEAFRLNHSTKANKIQAEFAGRASIGHVRYATCGAESKYFAQPFERRHGCKWKWFGMAFNGQLSNFAQLRADLLAQNDYHLTRDNDTEVLMHYIAHALRGDERPDLVEAFKSLTAKFDGAFNIVFLNAMGDMVVLRDPLGIRPLCIGHDGPLFAAASESVPLLNLGMTNVRSLEPGEIVVISDGQVRYDRIAPKRTPAHCFFEWIYFANVASVLDERSVYLSRSALGEELARLELADNRVRLDEDTIVVPVPDTGKAAADAMAHRLRIRSVEGLMRNRYVGRTFIEGENRSDRAKLKYTPLREVLHGKRVLLIEDTIVRSTTMKSLLHHLRERGGAKEIHVRVACPPIIAPCFYGIDMSRVSELFAPKYMAGATITEAEQAQMAKDLGADSLRYLPLDSVARAIGLPAERLCRACLTGDYPTRVGEQLYQVALRQRDEGITERTYELGAVRS